ncbi:MAG: S8 family serine peptidase [Flavobacteriales bacterium]|nr:S8 family serine peptidase [Flavobacteriales bacterium]
MATLITNQRIAVLLFFFTTLFHTLNAQTNCAVNSVLSQGYTVSIQSVVANANGTHTIVLKVLNNGCSGCKKINNFTVQAAAGTYSNVSVQLLSGAFTYSNISLGPTLSNCSFSGFRINGTNGMGNGQPAAFTVTYTLSGAFQNQRTEIKAGSANTTYTSNFTAANFQAVKDCLAPPPPAGIIPYFTPFANKTNDIIGVELRSLYNVYLSNGTIISNDIFQILGNSVRITIRTQPTQHAAAVTLLSSPTYGLVQELNDPANNLVNGTLPILNLLSLNSLPNLLVSARPIYAPLRNAGLITSQGDTSLRSFRARDVFGVDGSGIKVGVISDSYNTIIGNPAADDVLRGDLPGVTNAAHPTPVQVLQDYPFGTRSDEGRAMLQIVHDVAPGADLAFRTGFLGPVDMANGIRALEQSGCDVIVDDVSYISEPFFRDGVIAQAVDAVKALGVSYFSSAGNFGTNSWQGTFASATAPAGVTGTAHNFASGFGGTDVLQSVKLYQGDYTIVLQWDDGTAGTTTNSDLDIYLATNTGSTLFGFNRMNIGGDPIEILPFTVTADSVQSNIMIVRAAGSASTLLKYVVYRGKVKINEYNGLTASTITGQANAAGAIAVGAVLYTNTPEYGVAAPTPASFSSRGGTLVNGVDRNKPDLCAPNGVNTSVNLGGVNIDGDDFPNFFGTSAAAPHAAGVAALVQHARNKYYGNSLAPDLLKGLLQNSATDMGAPGLDAASGAGFILADSALMGLANPTPYITSISYDTTLTPGVDTLLLTVYGEYLDEGSTVWLDGSPLTNGVVIQGDSAIITLVDPFSGLYPQIQVYNPPQAGTNGTDGGLSNPLYFTTKETVLVTVGDASKKYGEELPGFTAVYTMESVDGTSVPLETAGLTPSELARIQAIDLTTIATPFSNVGLWAISGDLADPLNPKSSVAATTPLDLSLLQQYNFAFDDGLLTIDPLDLVITPRDTTVVYNDSIQGVNFDYALSNSANVTTTSAQTIRTGVKTAHGTALVNKVGLVRGTALVNGNGDQLLTADLLNNFSCMISQAVKSTKGTALVNGELIDPAELYHATAFANATARSVRGTALVNAYKLVRGTALVNGIDLDGNVTNTTSLTNSSSLVNSSGLLNSTTITLNSNTQTLAIIGDSDIAILSGDSTGDVEIRSVSLITGNTVGTHLIIPGTYLSNNFNVSYALGHLTVLPATAQFSIAPATLAQTYDGTPRSVDVSVVPADVPYTVTYNGSATLPVNAGTYTVQVNVNDPNYVGSLSATLVIDKATAQITITPGTLTQTYNGSAKSVAVTTVPAGLTNAVTYNGSATAPVNAGSYAVVATVNDPNYTGTASATLEVLKATATVTITTNSCTQTYNGSARTVTVTTSPAGLATTVTYNGSTTAPVNAGSYAVVATVNNPNYTGTASATMVIQKASAVVTITTNSCTQTYNGTARTVTVTTSPAGLATTVTYNGSTTAPVNAGSYAVVATVSNPNYTGSRTATMVIQKATATIALGALTQTYTGTARTVTVTTVPAGLTCTVTYSGSTTPKVNAGSYAVVATVNDVNYTGSRTGTLVIQKAPATATTGIYAMSKGGSIPSFTATYSGFLNGQTASVVTSVSFSLSPSCTGNVAGVYQIIVNATAANYTFTSVNGTLYVNPAGSGTKQIKPVFVCRETLSAPGAGGYMYVARFRYENQNATPVYIPVGTKNVLTGSGFLATGQPVVFQPGGGTWTVPYNGSTLQWQITSNKSPSGTGVLSANASSTACVSAMMLQDENTTDGEIATQHDPTNGVAASQLDEVDTAEEVDAILEESTDIRMLVYPNPSTGMVFLESAVDQPAGTSIEVYNALGRRCAVRVERPTDRKIELDLSSYGKGMYLINVIHNGDLRAYPVIVE